MKNRSKSGNFFLVLCMVGTLILGSKAEALPSPPSPTDACTSQYGSTSTSIKNLFSNTSIKNVPCSNIIINKLGKYILATISLEELCKNKICPIVALDNELNEVKLIMNAKILPKSRGETMHLIKKWRENEQIKLFYDTITLEFDNGKKIIMQNSGGYLTILPIP